MIFLTSFNNISLKINKNKLLNKIIFLKNKRKISQIIIQNDFRAFRACIIGSGPAGFYTTDRLFKGISRCKIDMYEALPAPFGLVRLGVAPDHYDIKNVQNRFSEIANYKGFSFIGNVCVGKDVFLKQLKPHYDCIIMAYGASKDKELGLSGENNLKGVYSARSFVNWYNGHYEYQEFNPDLESSNLAIIIGHGNVALDIARILLIDPKVLEKTDISEKALECLKKSKIKHVKIIGRRGPLQMSFSTKELRRLVELSGVSFYTPDLNLYINQSILSNNLSRSQKRLFDFLLKENTLKPNINNKLWSLEFFLSPRQLIKHELKSNTLSSVLFEKNILKKYPNNDTLQIVGTNETINIDTSCLIRSIGYKGIALENSDEMDIPFDTDKGIIPNVFGRVLSKHKGKTSEIHQLPGIYTAGWIKTGPVGVIANTMHDAFETSNSIIEDWNAGKPFLNPNTVDFKPGFNALLTHFKNKNIRFIEWKDWKKLEDLEYKKGEKLGKIREKFTSIKEILEILE